jgi:hypothetical protein
MILVLLIILSSIVLIANAFIKQFFETRKLKKEI